VQRRLLAISAFSSRFSFTRGLGIRLIYDFEIEGKAEKKKLLKDRPHEGKSTYSACLLYSVEEEGVEKACFASPEVHQQFAELGCKGGDEIRLTKIAEENGNRGAAGQFQSHDRTGSEGCY
jgi:hypothetical protein